MDSLQQALHQSVFLSALSAHPSRDLPLCWEQHCKLLPGVAGVQASGVAHWTVEEVRHVSCVCVMQLKVIIMCRFNNMRVFMQMIYSKQPITVQILLIQLSTSEM